MPLKPLQYEKRVAIVTGAGRGLGREYALLLASRGAKVLVNDFGGSVKGASGDGDNPADNVVAEIKKAGGEATANYLSVTDGDKIVEQAINTYGRVDILVNNAGILRDRMFSNMSDGDWQAIMDVHLFGAFKMTKAAWPHMKKQKYGRIINVCSAAGLYGNIGQANYSTAKLGLVGFTNTLALEGAKSNITANCIAPIAASRMTEKLLPGPLQASLKPAFVAPFVAYLVHDSCTESGSTFEVGAGWCAKIRIQRSQGHFVRNPKGQDSPSPEGVGHRWKNITQFDKGAVAPASPKESIASMVKAKVYASTVGRFSKL
jgi:NAD(P)-dependent dehydrogenase (short-subunit alcohol dehydrogenase family)